ncbi:MAG: DUF456 domain-containing protein [Pirellulaceae bacterium]|jgi:hypothetical protein|nr:DUF456 domain-containing protein [Pirellulaceae bacterium]HJN10374.1 DUF456 domain-containing protein [Pirellulaceae bacterium]
MFEFVEPMFEVIWALLFLLAVVICWAVNIAGLPGNWMVAGLAALYSFLVADDLRADVGWIVVVVLLILALLGELIEFAAGAVGTTSAGGSKRGAALSLLGSLIGGFVGIPVGALIPIPVVGFVIGVLFFASLGALVGAVMGEQWKGRDMEEALRIGNAAFWSRLAGTLGKIGVGAVMVAVLIAALILR